MVVKRQCVEFDICSLPSLALSLLPVALSLCFAVVMCSPRRVEPPPTHSWPPYLIFFFESNHCNSDNCGNSALIHIVDDDTVMD